MKLSVRISESINEIRTFSNLLRGRFIASPATISTIRRMYLCLYTMGLRLQLCKQPSLIYSVGAALAFYYRLVLTYKLDQEKLRI